MIVKSRWKQNISTIKKILLEKRKYEKNICEKNREQIFYWFKIKIKVVQLSFHFFQNPENTILSSQRKTEERINKLAWRKLIKVFRFPLHKFEDIVG